MSRTRHIVFILLLIFTGLEGFSQNLSNRGKEFWVGYGHHQFMEPGQNNSQEMILYFSTEPGQPANVTVIVRGRTATQTTNYVVPGGTVIASNFMPKAGATDCRLYDVPPTFGGNGGEGVFNVSIQIQSDVPIVAYAHTFGSASSGATMLMPVETYGYQYISINSRQFYANNCFSWAYVVATEDNTVVEITPSVLTRLNKPAGVPFTVNLNKGQIYQIIGANPTNGNAALEVSGTTFKSIANASGDCYPIAVFSGSSRTTNPISCGSNGGDNDNQQLFPTQAWGKRYLTAPTSRSTAANQFMTNSYKVLVKDPTTIVRRNGVILTGLQQNSFYFFESNTADLIEADKPVMVAQFMTGGTGCMGGGVGDPEMIYISPIEQGIKRIGFYRNTRENIQVNYLTLIIPTNGISSLRIDGSAAFDHSYPHPRLSGYTVVVKRWTAAQAQATAFSDSAFTAITYGLGNVESYGYNAGTRINNLNAVSSIQNVLDPSVPEHQFTCTGTPVKLSVLMAYQPTRIDWQLSLLGAALTPNADVTDLAPVSNATVVVNGVTYYKYSLPGNYQFNWADTFYITIRGYHPSIENCYNRETLMVPVIVKQKPLADFTFSHTGCTLDTVYFSSASNTSNGYTVRDYNWTFPGPVMATGQNANVLLAPGTHNVNLNVVTTEGCSSDTTKMITIYDKPPADFQITPASLCEGATFTITDTSSATIAVNEWYWDFGNGVIQTVTSGPSVTYTYPAPGTYTIKHVAKSSATCISDTVSRVVTVYSKPTVSFTNDAAGCLDPSGLVNFTGIATTPDGQTFTSYSWNFGDPNATPGNPNTSGLQNPSHNYQQGTYSINFSATTVNGCTKDTTMSFSFNLKPVLQYPALPAVCENAPATSVATAFVTNAVTGTGVYSGPGTSPAGMFNPVTAGFGTHTIWYRFTSAAGCQDSVSQTILVHAKPQPNFTFPNTGCLPPNGQVQFTNTSTIADAQTMTWLWNFGDPNATPGNPNTSTIQNPSHNYGEGTFNINLTANSNNGCVKDTTITAVFAVTPVFNYPALAAVCENNTSVSVATASVTNGLSGTGIYIGPGTSPAGMFNPAAAGFGTHTIWYRFTTNGGCVDSVSQTILVHAKPVPQFTFSSGCLSTNGQVQFTNTSTIADAQTMTWLWNFGDPNATPGNPNTSTSQNPTHNYSEGTYNIMLTATSNNGCVKDTTIAATFAVTPALTFAPLAAVCQNPGAPLVSVAQASVTNGVSGTGVYNGPGTSSAGMFDPNAAGPGIHTINYTFTSGGGCVQMISRTIEVYPRPTALFSVNNNSVCLGQSVTFSNASAISSGTINTWNWNFGDGNTASYTNGNPFSVTYVSANTYNVSLIAVSDRGCISSPHTATVTIRPNPATDFTLPTGICMPGGTAQFNNLSTVSDNSGLSYQWNFGDGNTSGVMSPSHVYGAIGSYNVSLTATSGFGCVNQIQKVLNDFYDKPVSGYSVSAPEICLGNDIIFTDASSAPNSTVQSWAWNFNDGTSSVIANPVKRYTTAGFYDVTLTVRNAVGCTSDVFTTTVTVHPQPIVNAGPDYILPQGNTVQINATSNSPGGPATTFPPFNYIWTPSIGLSDPAILNPALTAIQDQVYILTATGSFGCNDTDAIVVKILKPVKVPNVFSPNGDNIHDTWLLPNLADYPGATVEVFNRYGQQVFYSKGYAVPWDGKMKGKELPFGTYYYVIQLQNGFKPMTGSVTIIR